MKPPSRPPSRPVRWLSLWEELRAAARPLLVYWVFLVAMMSAFVLAIEDIADVWVIIPLVLTTFAAVALGQTLAFLRVRDGLVFAFALLFWTVGPAFILAVLPHHAEFVALLILFSLFLTGGLWSLRGRALAAAWVPLVYATAAAVLAAEAHDKVFTWKAGKKYAVWEQSTIGVLVLGIVLLLAYLAAREGHRLVLWRRGPRAPLAATQTERGASRPRLTVFGWAILGMLGVGVALGSAVLSPYLWRTEVREEKEEKEDDDAHRAPDNRQDHDGRPPLIEDGEDGRVKEVPKERRRQGKGEAGRMMEVREALRPAERSVSGVVIDPLQLLLLLVAGLVIGGPPVRRLLLVERLRNPPPGTPSTTCVQGAWRLVELAVTDAGVELRPGEPAARLIARAQPVLDRLLPLPVQGLMEAAEIRDRVAYGLGVAPGDVIRMREVAARAYDTVWDRLGDARQIRALYRIFLDP